MALVQVRVPYKEGYDYGVGADLASGSPMGKVVGGAFSGVENALGATTKWEITRIHSTSDLETKLGINVEASYGCGAFGGVSARFDYAKNSKIQSSSLFMAITAYVELEFQSIDDPTLTPLAEPIVNRADVFSTRYGNMFVRGVGRGGLFVGVIQIDTSSSEDSESISAELEGSYGLFSAEAKTKFDSIQRDHRSEIRISVYHEGGPIDLTMQDITNPAQLYDMLQQWLKSFQDYPEQNAKPYYVTLAPIAIANGPIPPNIAQIQHAQDILVLCAKQRSTILDGLNLMDYIVQNASRYDFVAPTTRADIVKASVGYQADLDLVAETASQAINDVTKAVTPAEFALKIGKPYPQGVPPTPVPLLRASSSEDPIALMWDWIKNNDALAAPYFAVPAGGGIEQPIPGPSGGRFVLFNSSLRVTTIDRPPVFGLTGGIFWHPDLGAHYVYALIFLRYEVRYKFCFDHMGGHMGYPMGNQTTSTDQGFNLRQQRFEGGWLSPDMEELDNEGNPIPNIRPEELFRWGP